MEIRDFLGNCVPQAEAAFIAATRARREKERRELLADIRESHEDRVADQLDARAEAAGEDVHESQALPNCRLAKRPRVGSHRHTDRELARLLGDAFAGNSISIKTLRRGVAAIGVMAASFQTAGAGTPAPSSNRAFAQASVSVGRDITMKAEGVRREIELADASLTEAERAGHLQIAGVMGRSAELGLAGYIRDLQRSMPGTPAHGVKLGGPLRGAWHVSANVNGLANRALAEFGEVRGEMGRLDSEKRHDPFLYTAPMPS